MAVVLTQQVVNSASSSNAGATATYTSKAIGTAAADRIVFLSVSSELASGTPNSATIDFGGGAVAMNVGALGTLGSNHARIFWLLAPTGTTATFVVTFGANPSSTSQHISVHSSVGGTFVFAGQNSSTDMDVTAPLTTGANWQIPTNGGFLAVASCGTNTVAKAWAGATEDADVDGTTMRHTTAKSTTGGIGAITCTGTTNNEDGAMSFVSIWPTAVAFGDVIGAAHVAVASRTDPLPIDPPGLPVSIGDLIVVNCSDQSTTTDFIVSISDGLGNTYTALNDTASQGLCHGYYSRITTAGLAVISADMSSANTDDAIVMAVAYKGMFDPIPLDINTAATSDASSTYTAAATGTLAQADELIVGLWGNRVGGTYSTPGAGSRLDWNTQIGATVGAAITSLVVAATTTVTLTLQGTASTAGINTVATFKKGFYSGSASGSGTATAVGVNAAVGVGKAGAGEAAFQVDAFQNDAFQVTAVPSGTAVGVGFALTAGNYGTATGSGTATATGLALVASNGTATGSGTATATGTGVIQSNGTGTGTGTTTAEGLTSVIAQAVGKTSGEAAFQVDAFQNDAFQTQREVNGTATAVGQVGIPGSIGSAIGSGTATATGASAAGSMGSAVGSGTATASSNANVGRIGTAVGSGSATATGASTAASMGSAVGSGTAAGTTSADAAKGIATGSGTATATGASTAQSIGTAVGSGTATASTNANVSRQGSAVGSGTATATSQSTAASMGQAVGSGTATATGRSNAASMGQAVGSGTATGSRASTAASMGSAVGSGTITAYSIAGSNSNGAAVGVGSATATGRSNAASMGQAVGSGTAIGISSADSARGTATGSGTATASGTAGKFVIGAAVGAGSATATGRANVGRIGLAIGSGTATAAGRFNVLAIGQAAGSGTATATTNILVGAVGSANGFGTAAAHGKSGTVTSIRLLVDAYEATLTIEEYGATVDADSRMGVLDVTAVV